MPHELPSLGEFEIRVLRLVWQHQPCTEREISDLIKKQRPLARTTVLKTMQRLVAKGLLVRQHGQRPVRFCAAMDEKHLLPTLIRRFVEGALGGSPGPLVAYLADSKKLSPEDIEALRVISRKVTTEPHET